MPQLDKRINNAHCIIVSSVGLIHIFMYTYLCIPIYVNYELYESQSSKDMMPLLLCFHAFVDQSLNVRNYIHLDSQTLYLNPKSCES